MVSYKRHLAKAVSYRIVGTLYTIIISSIITGSWNIGLTLGGLEIISKLLLYFVHERAWYKLSKFGIKENK